MLPRQCDLSQVVQGQLAQARDGSGLGGGAEDTAHSIAAASSSHIACYFASDRITSRSRSPFCPHPLCPGAIFGRNFSYML